MICNNIHTFFSLKPAGWKSFLLMKPVYSSMLVYFIVQSLWGTVCNSTSLYLQFQRSLALMMQQLNAKHQYERHYNPLLMILWYLVAWPFHICEGTCLSTTISNINCKMWILSWLLFAWKLRSQKLNKFWIYSVTSKFF